MATQTNLLDTPQDGKTTLFSQISKLEGENRRLRSAARDRGAIEAELRERVKELNCLYGITQLVETHDDRLEPLLQGIVDLLPPSWQYPDVCCARLTLDHVQYTTDAFRKSSWKQTADVIVAGEACGLVEVYYLKEMHELDEGPFLREERALINAVAERAGKIVERIRAERRLHEAMKQLQVERAALEQANAALRGVLARIEEEKKSVKDSIMANVDKVLMPVLHALETELSPHHKKYVALLKGHLEEITSPFADKISKAFMTLTAIEIQICQMIRNGMTSKEIAQLRHVAPATVARQRERIRKKLRIAGTDTNLTTYLSTFL